MSDFKDQNKKAVQHKGRSAQADNKTAVQLQDNRPRTAVQKKQAGVPVQRKNKTGLPDGLKSGIESMSGMSMDDVKVHYNSSQPAQLNAHAFAKGSQIHVGPGQEKHLPHEAWHVVQQKQGRVQPTAKVGGVSINDNKGLENEADHMGARALQMKAAPVRFKSMADHGLNDVDYSYMSHEQYGGWRGTVQGKFMHCATPCGDGVVVTQFRSGSETAQLAGYFTGKIRGGLIIGEGILAIAGGIATMMLGGASVVPGVLSAGVGVLKVVRGIVTMHGGEQQTPKHLAVADALRLVESSLTIASGAHTKNAALLVFGVAKAIRSLITALTDYMGKDTSQPMFRKGLMYLATLCHSIEVAAGLTAGVQGIKNAESGNAIASGITNIGIAASKGARTIDQGKIAHESHRNPEEQPINDAQVQPI